MRNLKVLVLMFSFYYSVILFYIEYRITLVYKMYYSQIPLQVKSLYLSKCNKKYDHVFAPPKKMIKNQLTMPMQHESVVT